MTNTFEALGLAAPLLRAVADLGFEITTPVQAQAIPAALNGGDWMVSSQTGSGKTAAFLLPILHTLSGQPERGTRFPAGPRALVLCPTRELAQQVSADAIKLVRHARGIRIATVVGGLPFGRQIALLKGASIVVATPGRLLDLFRRREIRLDTVERMVVDEADRMLDLGFSEDLDEIHRLCAQREQTLMFSATFAPRIMQLAARITREAGRLELATAQDVHTDIEQTLHWADGLAHKKKLLEHWLRDASLDQALVFASTQADTETLAGELAAGGHSVAALHGAMPQSVRNRQLKGLRDGRIRILVATDVAARGIDVPSISHVINFGLPMKAEDYVHRIGRTGRAGRSGQAITLAEFRDRPKIRAIEHFTQQRLATSEIPGLEPRAPSRSGQPPNGRARPGGRGRNESAGRGTAGMPASSVPRKPDYGVRAATSAERRSGRPVPTANAQARKEWSGRRSRQDS